MTSSLAEKLDFVLKALSMSRGRLAVELAVDKSAVGRWISGATEPSPHSMAQLTAVISRRVEGFTALDWERDLDDLAKSLGVAPPSPSRLAKPAAPALAVPLLEESLATIRLRGGAYEGFYRTTRPYGQSAGLFIHDHVMIRSEPGSFLKLTMNASGVMVEGQVMLLQNQLFFAGAELTSGSFVFAIFNGVSTLRAGLIDGLILFCSQDPGRTPTASAAIFERIGDLSGDREIDDARFRELGAQGGLATEETAPENVREHLARDFGPSHAAAGGDLLLCLPLVRSMSQGLSVVPGAPPPRCDPGPGRPG